MLNKYVEHPVFLGPTCVTSVVISDAHELSIMIYPILR